MLIQQAEQLHAVPVAASRIGVGRSTAYELIRSGELRSVKIRARRLVPESAIAEFIAGLSAA